MKFLILLLFIPFSIFAQTDQELSQRNKARIDSLLKRVDKAANDITHMQQEENVVKADSLIKVVDRLAMTLNENQTQSGNDVLKVNDSALSKITETKHYYIVIAVYANQKLAQQNKIFHKLNYADVVKSRKGKYYYLAIPCMDGTKIQNEVEKYEAKNKCDAWWVRL
ncbi:MAG: hypothetical protein V4608_14080 [Bacteroidota bacterium]